MSLNLFKQMFYKYYVLKLYRDATGHPCKIGNAVI